MSYMLLLLIDRTPFAFQTLTFALALLHAAACHYCARNFAPSRKLLPFTLACWHGMRRCCTFSNSDGGGAGACLLLFLALPAAGVCMIAGAGMLYGRRGMRAPARIAYPDRHAFSFEFMLPSTTQLACLFGLVFVLSGGWWLPGTCRAGSPKFPF